MRQTMKRSVCIWVVLILFVAGLALHCGKLAVKAREWVTSPFNTHLFADGQITTAGKIYDRNGVILAESKDGKRVFNDSREIREATVFAVGDLNGYISTGAHSAFLADLTGYDFLNGVYQTNGGNDVTLTIDSKVCVTAVDAMNGYSGAVGVMNYLNGELICMVSGPTFDPVSPPLNSSSDGTYVNRLVTGQYAPGSIFKLVTALSAIDNLSNLYERKYTCKGGVTIGGEWLSCLGNHGTINIQEALRDSCNAAFAQIALDVGREKMTSTADSIGFNKEMTVDGVKCSKSIYNVEGTNDIDFGWSGIGQNNDIVNPMQYLSFMASIANNGVLINPHYLLDVKTQSGRKIRSGDDRRSRLISADNSLELTEMMRANVTDHYGDFSGLSVCAKTGTAEIGTRGNPHSWFVGFCLDEEKPYAFVVVAENAGEGAGVARSVAASVLKAAPSVE